MKKITILIILIICTYLSSDLNEGLVAYYPFNGSANDESGNGNDGTVNGASLATDRFGSLNSAYEFDGDNDLIDVNNDSSLNFNGSFSVSLWFKPLVLNQYQRLVGKGTAVDGDISNWSITLVSNNTIAFFWESADDANHLVYSNTVINDTLFHNITVFVDIDLGEYGIFIDGDLDIIQHSSDIPAPNSNSLYIGVRRTQSSFERYFKGVIDDIYIFGRALSEPEIQQLYNIENNTIPVVSNVTGQQRGDGSFIVDIYYDVYDADSDAMTITMQVSDDDGLTWNVSCNFTSGDIGTNINSGNGKHIIWNVGSEHPNINTDFRFKIIADDAQYGTVTDIDGNVYQTLVIGDQEWMIENLKVTHYRNGDEIQTGYSNSEWENLSIGAYCFYDNDPSNGNTYGALYNWYAVDDTRELAPAGWHVPTDEEIMEIEMHLGMSSSEANNVGDRGTNEGSKLAGRADLWNDGDLKSDPEFGSSGFNFLPAGKRGSYDGDFLGMGNLSYFWSDTEYNIYGAWNRALGYLRTQVYRNGFYNENGYSIRCVRD